MKRRYLASILGALALLLAVGTATATAAAPGVQSVSQSAGSEQQATSASGATQIDPSNTNISVRVLSDGNDGPVTQSNTASSNATSSNSNSTSQDASQDQGAGGIQTSTQDAGNAQLADALSYANQSGASNTNLPVRVLSPGSNGAVTQSNYTGSTAGSTNTNTTGQTSDQDQSGGSCGCAAAPSSSPGVQSSDGSCGCAAAPSSSPGVQSSDGSCGCAAAPSSPGVQSSDQSAENEQLAGAASSATQVNPSNTNISVRVLSPGKDGAVDQSNTVKSKADATNTNGTTQTSDQDQSAGGCGCTPDPIQVAQQSSGSLQGALALSAADQQGAKNDASPVRVGSSGSNGKVDQSNSATSKADASNKNGTTQTADQNSGAPSGGCGCGGGLGIQVVGQKAENGQAAVAGSKTIQDFGKKSECGCSSSGNSDNPVRVWSPGSDGSVDQSNSATSKADASNKNGTTQTADQNSGAPSGGCGCGGGLGIQVVGQKAENGQAAVAGSKTIQDFGKKSECGCSSSGNSDNPVRVWSPGSDGSVDQSNSATSKADASNKNTTSQDGEQTQSGSGLNIQALGQEATNGQLGVALSGAVQSHPSNSAGDTRVKSAGGGGKVDQTNRASSTATTKNDNHTTQKGTQSQKGSSPCGCGSGPSIQVLGQSSQSLQLGFGLSAAVQKSPKNAAGGTAVWSPGSWSRGSGGPTRQANDASSKGVVHNSDQGSQLAHQLQ